MKSVTMAVAILVSAASTPALAQTAGAPATDTGQVTSPADDSHGTTTAPVTDPAAAAPAAAAPFTITGSAAIVSQYRFRGISQSDNKPAVQGSVTIAHSSGLYLSTWGSSANANNAVNIGGTEIDVYGGYTHALGKSGLTVDAGLYGYIYPGSAKAVGISESYYELYGSLAKTSGPVSLKVGAYWAPDQSYFKDFATRSRYSVYEYGEATYAVAKTPITLHAHVGHTGGGLDYVGHDYIDYTAGAGYKWKSLTFDVSAVGTDLSRADTRLADIAATTDDFHRAAKTMVVGSVAASF